MSAALIADTIVSATPQAAAPGDEDVRGAERRAFLAAAGEGGRPLAALPADASPRRYFRLGGGGAALLLMDVEPGSPDFPPFLAVAQHLAGLGLSAPRIAAVDTALGLALIEDFGAGTFTRLLAGGHDETALYALAVDALVALHRAPGAIAIDVPAYDRGPLFEELAMFADWYAPAVDPGLAGDPRRRAAFEAAFHAAWERALADVAGRREALVLRDFHVDNLMVLDGRQGPSACGLLDFQDALIGACAYDLVSLLQDARRDLAPGLELAMLDRYLAAMPELERGRFMADYWLLAAHRHTKVAGNFERLSKRDGKHGYLVHVPRVLRRLELALGTAGLGGIGRVLDDHLPGWRAYAPPAVAPAVSADAASPRSPA